MDTSRLAQGDATAGWAVGCSRRGAAHVRAGKPCQDAYAIWSGSAAGSPLLVVAVADGHGDERHDLSEFGSTLAIKVAIEEAAAFAAHFGLESEKNPLMNFRADFPRRVVRRWRELVRDDARDRIGDDAADSPATITRYGTTVLTAIIGPTAVLIGQLGDGDLLLVRPDGQIEMPFPPNPNEVGGATHSLSSSDAMLLWRTAWLPREPGGMILLATDGLSNSFTTDEQFHKFVRSLMERLAEHGIVNVAAVLPQWLDGYSERGSGDDVTVAMAWLPPAGPVPG